MRVRSIEGENRKARESKKGKREVRSIIPANCHNSTIIQNSNNEDKDSGEVPVVRKSENGKSEYDAHGDTHCVRRIVLHALENFSTLANRIDHYGKTGFGHYDIGGWDNRLAFRKRKWRACVFFYFFFLLLLSYPNEQLP